MEDKVLPMQQVAPPRHRCRPCEGQKPIRLGTGSRSCQNDVEVNDKAFLEILYSRKAAEIAVRGFRLQAGLPSKADEFPVTFAQQLID